MYAGVVSTLMGVALIGGPKFIISIALDFLSIPLSGGALSFQFLSIFLDSSLRGRFFTLISLDLFRFVSILGPPIYATPVLRPKSHYEGGYIINTSGVIKSLWDSG